MFRAPRQMFSGLNYKQSAARRGGKPSHGWLRWTQSGTDGLINGAQVSVVLLKLSGFFFFGAQINRLFRPDECPRIKFSSFEHTQPSFPAHRAREKELQASCEKRPCLFFPLMVFGLNV